jgi:hypothetical protein
MKVTPALKKILLLFSLLFLTACGGGGKSENTSIQSQVFLSQAQAAADGNVNLNLQVKDKTQVEGMQFELRYDSNAFTFDVSQFHDSIYDGYHLYAEEIQPGIVRVIALKEENIASTKGSVLAKLPFFVSGKAKGVYSVQMKEIMASDTEGKVLAMNASDATSVTVQ